MINRYFFYIKFFLCNNLFENKKRFRFKKYNPLPCKKLNIKKNSYRKKYCPTFINSLPTIYEEL